MKNYDLNGENLIFQEIPNNPGVGGIAFGLFKEDGTKLGESFCRDDKYEGKAWYLSDICISEVFQRKGYGTVLLNMTCEALCERKNLDIVLERPGDTLASDGFDRKAWYEKHGFVSTIPPLTYMIRYRNPT